MMTKRENQQIEMHLITIEDLVPTDHLLRKVNDIIDFYLYMTRWRACTAVIMAVRPLTRWS